MFGTVAKETNFLFSDKEPLRSHAIKEKSYFKIGILKQHSQNFTSVTVGEYLKDEHHKGWSELEEGHLTEISNIRLNLICYFPRPNALNAYETASNSTSHKR